MGTTYVITHWKWIQLLGQWNYNKQFINEFLFVNVSSDVNGQKFRDLLETKLLVDYCRYTIYESRVDG
jgi:hypothetical protein